MLDQPGLALCMEMGFPQSAQHLFQVDCILFPEEGKKRELVHYVWSSQGLIVYL